MMTVYKRHIKTLPCGEFQQARPNFNIKQYFQVYHIPFCCHDSLIFIMGNPILIKPCLYFGLLYIIQFVEWHAKYICLYSSSVQWPLLRVSKDQHHHCMHMLEHQFCMDQLGLSHPWWCSNSWYKSYKILLHKAQVAFVRLQWNLHITH